MPFLVSQSETLEWKIPGGYQGESPWSEAWNQAWGEAKL